MATITLIAPDGSDTIQVDAADTATVNHYRSLGATVANEPAQPNPGMSQQGVQASMPWAAERMTRLATGSIPTLLALFSGLAGSATPAGPAGGVAAAGLGGAAGKHLEFLANKALLGDQIPQDAVRQDITSGVSQAGAELLGHGLARGAGAVAGKLGQFAGRLEQKAGDVAVKNFESRVASKRIVGDLEKKLPSLKAAREQASAAVEKRIAEAHDAGAEPVTVRDALDYVLRQNANRTGRAMSAADRKAMLGEVRQTLNEAIMAHTGQSDLARKVRFDLTDAQLVKKSLDRMAESAHSATEAAKVKNPSLVKDLSNAFRRAIESKADAVGVSDIHQLNVVTKNAMREERQIAGMLKNAPGPAKEQIQMDAGRRLARTMATADKHTPPVDFHVGLTGVSIQPGQPKLIPMAKGVAGGLTDPRVTGILKHGPRSLPWLYDQMTNSNQGGN
jgi:hypothetical protein